MKTFKEFCETAIKVIDDSSSNDVCENYVKEQAGSEDRGERHVAHDAAVKKRDANQKTTIIPTASRPGNSPSLNLPMSSIPHVHIPKKTR